jgi:two-component system sensor histidine kinase CreC
MDDIQPRYREATEESIVDTAYSLAALASVTSVNGHIDIDLFRRMFKQLESQAFSAQIYSFVKTSVDHRIYITDAAGTVLFDSDGGRDEGADYSQWRDVYLTMRGEYGARTSPSRDDPETKVLYVASPIVHDGEMIGVLSVGKSSTNSNRFVDLARRDLLVGGIAIFLLLIALGALLGQWLSRPILRLTGYAKAVGKGERASLPAMPPGELRELGNAFEQMRVALEGKRYVENYVQTLSHEIKSPLSAIRGATELLEEDLPPEQRQRFLNNLNDESLRINRIVDTLLLLTSLESRNAIEAQGQFALDQIVSECIASLARLIEQRQLTIDSHHVVPAMVHGDEILIRQAVLNLLQNAIDFAPSQSAISIAIEANASEVQLTLRDHGPGIPVYAGSKIFDRFFSLARPDNGKKSSGLGLSLVKQIMSLHEGQVEISTHPQGGTEARLRFPVMNSAGD